ncbi:type VI secretion system baseplate subunit TssF, partial [Pseudomonas syringae]
QACSALRLTLDCLGEKTTWSALTLQHLRLHLNASPVVNAVLYDLLGAHTIKVLSGAPGSLPAAEPTLPAIVGFADDEALLPEEDGVHPGRRLIAEYFAFPEKFNFFDIPVHAAHVEGQTLYLYLVFDRAPQ